MTKKVSAFFLILSALSSGLFPLNLQAQDTENTQFNKLYTIGKRFVQERNSDSALYYFDKSLEVAPSSLDSAQSIVETAWVYYFTGMTEEASQRAHLIMEMEPETIDPTFRDAKSDVAGLLRAIHYFDGDYENAHKYSLYQREILSLDSVNHLKLIVIYINLSTETWSMKRYDEALEYAEQNLIRINSYPSYQNQREDRIRTYIMIGLINADTKRYKKAIEYYRYAFDLIGIPDLNSYRNYVSVCNNIANVYQDRGQLQKALQYYEKANEVLKTAVGTAGYPNYKVTVLNNMGEVHTELGNLEEGQRLLEEATELANKYLGAKHKLTVRNLYWKSLNRSEAKKHEQALLLVDKAIDLTLESYDAFGTTMTQYYVLKAQILSGMGLIQEASEYLDKSFHSNTNLDIDDKLLFIYPKGATQASELKLEILQAQKLNPTQLIDSIIMVYDKIIGQSVHSYALGMGEASETDRLFDMFFKVAWPLYQETEDQGLFSLLWKLSEYDKSRRLLTHLNDKRAIENTIPEDYRKRQRAIQDSIEYYQNKNLEDTTFTQEHLLDLKNEISALQKDLEEEFPEYYKLKYQQSIVSHQELMDDSKYKNLLLIEYYLSDSILFATSFDRGKSQIISIALDSSFFNHLEIFSNAIQDPFSKKDSLYTQSAFYLFQKLLAPFTKTSSLNEILIIPSGELALIPFEALLTQKVNHDEKVDYKNLPYLIKEFSVGYANSVTLLNQLSERPSREKGQKVLAMAPSFNTKEFKDSLRGAFGNLVHSLEESENISAYFPTTILRDFDAKESSFGEMANDYSILHIASHAWVDGADPMYSKIAFAPDPYDSLDDGYLHVFELLNNSLNLELAVLSACNTGSGKVERGEGVMSLAQAFFYSGTRSVVMSLWPANDRSTAEVMELFYKYLAEGNRKSQALRNAKLEYLENADNIKSHPFYWAQFVANGDLKPLSKNNDTWIYLLLIGSLILVTIMAIRRKRLNRSSSL